MKTTRTEYTNDQFRELMFHARDVYVWCPGCYTDDGCYFEVTKTQALECVRNRPVATAGKICATQDSLGDVFIG